MKFYNTFYILLHQRFILNALFASCPVFSFETLRIQSQLSIKTFYNFSLWNLKYSDKIDTDFLELKLPASSLNLHAKMRKTKASKNYSNFKLKNRIMFARTTKGSMEVKRKNILNITNESERVLCLFWKLPNVDPNYPTLPYFSEPLNFRNKTKRFFSFLCEKMHNFFCFWYSSTSLRSGPFRFVFVWTWP